MIKEVGDNFSELYYKLLIHATNQPTEYTESRNGLVKDLGPAYIEIYSDTFRLPILQKRAINPFFALAEYSWLVTGSNLLEPLQFFIKNYGEYSDDELTLNGAYGYRLKNKFNIDQIEIAISTLKENPTTRRVVVTMWSHEDLGAISNDIPCNTSIMFKIREKHLDMTVINRSNDLFLGVPYNVFMFYLLQCYMAKAIGCKIGKQRHFTDSLHVYEKHESKINDIIDSNANDDLVSIFNRLSTYNSDNYLSVNHNSITKLEFNCIDDDYYERFFLVYSKYKLDKNYDNAISMLPKDLMGYAGYLWLSEYAGVIPNVDYFLNHKIETELH
ncbi:thymidylate synthase [Paenibacillus harenae]|uniref:thymidylate synthase n=1 Tax=Paenibacillus harenae TaxID=306543 RepID=A0ABT9U9T3_PAEHA|nr:thymidylate synthase [Paenibacillus harenae]MDQ0114954.1 thymidylate synthase [Paenibacillus harenae]